MGCSPPGPTGSAVNAASPNRAAEGDEHIDQGCPKRTVRFCHPLADPSARSEARQRSQSSPHYAGRFLAGNFWLSLLDSLCQCLAQSLCLDVCFALERPCVSAQRDLSDVIGLL